MNRHCFIMRCNIDNKLHPSSSLLLGISKPNLRFKIFQFMFANKAIRFIKKEIDILELESYLQGAWTAVGLDLKV